MGSYLAQEFMLRHGNEIAAVVLSAVGHVGALNLSDTPPTVRLIEDAPLVAPSALDLAVKALAAHELERPVVAKWIVLLSLAVGGGSFAVISIGILPGAAFLALVVQQTVGAVYGQMFLATFSVLWPVYVGLGVLAAVATLVGLIQSDVWRGEHEALEAERDRPRQSPPQSSLAAPSFSFVVARF
jgi:pimeloyl-ACP methyl ester carboxylesterase